MNRRENGVAVMNTPRRAFGELKNFSYATTPRPLDSFKGRALNFGKGAERVHSEEPIKKVAVPIAVEPQSFAPLPQLKKADSLEELCNIAIPKRSFAVWNDDDDEIETFGMRDDDLPYLNLDEEKTNSLLEDYPINQELKNVSLSTISEASLEEWEETPPMEAPFAGGSDCFYDDFGHFPEDVVLSSETCILPTFFSSIHEEIYSDIHSEVDEDDVVKRCSELEEMLVRMSFNDFMY